MSLILDGSNGITFPNSSTQAVGFYGFKNRIINGAMVIDQRNAGASVTIAVSQTYSVDRWKGFSAPTSKYSLQQNAGAVTPPAGFKNYVGATSLSAYSVGAAEYEALSQIIEGYNVADLGWGTANAQSVTLSFWVRSSLTGTFGGSLLNAASVNRSYPFTYTINSANTWEYKTITIAGDQSGTWVTDNTGSIALNFGLGVGSNFSGTAGAWNGNFNFSATGATSVVGTNGATFYITGVQLEAGSTATSFDYRPYGTELNLCQRYFQYLAGSTATGDQYIASGMCNTSVQARFPYVLPVQMRVGPAVTFPSASNFVAYSGAATPTVTALTTAGTSDPRFFAIVATVASGLTAGYGAILLGENTTSSAIQLSAEL